jgi:hypothetical protein
MEHRSFSRVMFLVTSLLLTFTLSQFANSQSHANHTAPSTINGSEHPELIPDSVAYRLIFTTLSQPGQDKLQVAQVNGIGLSKEDAQVMIQNLNVYRTAFDALVGNYNKALKDGEQPNADLFNLQLEVVLANTRGALDSALSKEGSVRLKAFVENEKRHMQMSDGKQVAQ